jgi:hypothetical protein
VGYRATIDEHRRIIDNILLIIDSFLIKRINKCVGSKLSDISGLKQNPHHQDCNDLPVLSGPGISLSLLNTLRVEELAITTIWTYYEQF